MFENLNNIILAVIICFLRFVNFNNIKNFFVYRNQLYGKASYLDFFPSE